MSSTIPFEVPDQFIKHMATGAAKRVGANIVNTATGRIMGHVQETGAFPIPPIPSALPTGPVSALASGVNMASSLAQNVQLEQVKSMLGGLRMLSGANLALSVVGVGVSVMGFAVMSKKLDRLSARLMVIESRVARIEQHTSEMIRWMRAEQFGSLRAALARAEEAWEHSNAAEVWRNLDGRLHESEYKFRDYLMPHGDSDRCIFIDPSVRLEACYSAYDTILIASAARLQVLIALGEHRVAASYADGFARWHDELAAELSTDRVLRAKRSGHGVKPRSREEVSMRSHLDDFMEGVHLLEESLASRADLPRTLYARQLNGRAYLERARNERSAPVLILPAG